MTSMQAYLDRQQLVDPEATERVTSEHVEVALDRVREAAAEACVRWSRFLEALESNDDVETRRRAFRGALAGLEYRSAVYHSAVADQAKMSPVTSPSRVA